MGVSATLVMGVFPHVEHTAVSSCSGCVFFKLVYVHASHFVV